MSRKVDLWEYLPPFLQRFLEFRKLIDAENPEFQTLFEELDKMFDNTFIQTADLTGIQRFEKILGISAGTEEGLQARRNTVMTRWNDITPYTLKTLKEKLASLQGNANIDFEFTAPYELTIITRLEQVGQVEDLKFFFNTMIPCNLLIHSVNRLEGTAETGLFYGLGASCTGTLFLTNDLNGEFRNELVLFGGVGASMTETHVDLSPQ